MDDDFETANALTVIFDFTKNINKLLAENKLSNKNVVKIKDFMKTIDKIFSILQEERHSIPKEVKELVKKREKARKNKDFKNSDNIREKIKSLGFYIDDTKEGYIIKKL